MVATRTFQLVAWTDPCKEKWMMTIPLVMDSAYLSRELFLITEIMHAGCRVLRKLKKKILTEAKMLPKESLWQKIKTDA